MKLLQNHCGCAENRTPRTVTSCRGVGHGVMDRGDHREAILPRLRDCCVNTTDRLFPATVSPPGQESQWPRVRGASQNLRSGIGLDHDRDRPSCGAMRAGASQNRFSGHVEACREGQEDRPGADSDSKGEKQRLPCECPKGSQKTDCGPEKTMFLYFIRSCSAANLIKIGYSANPVKRLAALQTGSSHKLELLGQIPVVSLGRARDLESKAHRVFCYCRVDGEWFTSSRPLREFMAACEAFGPDEALALAYRATKKKIRKSMIGRSA